MFSCIYLLANVTRILSEPGSRIFINLTFKIVFMFRVIGGVDWRRFLLIATRPWLRLLFKSNSTLIKELLVVIVFLVVCDSACQHSKSISLKIHSLTSSFTQGFIQCFMGFQGFQGFHGHHRHAAIKLPFKWKGFFCFYPGL